MRLINTSEYTIHELYDLIDNMSTEELEDTKFIAKAVLTGFENIDCRGDYE